MSYLYDDELMDDDFFDDEEYWEEEEEYYDLPPYHYDPIDEEVDHDF